MNDYVNNYVLTGTDTPPFPGRNFCCILLLGVFIGPLSFIASSIAYSQEKVYSCGSNGEIVEFSRETCSIRSLGHYGVFGDIAVTRSGVLYGISDRLYRIDTIAQTSLAISPMLISTVGGLGLLALDDNTLLYDKSDSLFIYNLTLGTETLLGQIGYETNGDFTMFQANLYMISVANELIRIELDSTNNSIISITNIGLLNTQSLTAYSIFSTSNDCESSASGLYVIDQSYIYSVDPASAEVEGICNLGDQHVSFGTATLNGIYNGLFSANIPNVFTPNYDGINDEYVIFPTDKISQFRIMSRWGNEMYSWNSGPLSWDGVEVSEGVYFYQITYTDCGQKKTETGNITLIK